MLAQQEVAPDADPLEGDPLESSADTVAAALPPWLAAACGGEAEAVWATALAVAALEALEFCWMPEEEEPETIVDRAHEWLEARLAAHFPVQTLKRERPRKGVVAALTAMGAAALEGLLGLESSRLTEGREGSGADAAELQDGDDPMQALHTQAAAACRGWHDLFLARVKTMRRVEFFTLHGFLAAMQQAAGDIGLSFLVKVRPRPSQLLFHVVVAPQVRSSIQLPPCPRSMRRSATS